jgi:hypothetical protein
VTNVSGTFSVPKFLHKLCVAYISLVHDTFVTVLAVQVLDVSVLETHIVIVIHFVNDDDLVSTLQQEVGYVAANETTSSSN